MQMRTANESAGTKKKELFIRHLFDSNVYIPSAVDEGKFVSFFVHLVRSFTLISRMIFFYFVSYFKRKEKIDHN